VDHLKTNLKEHEDHLPVELRRHGFNSEASIDDPLTRTERRGGEHDHADRRQQMTEKGGNASGTDTFSHAGSTSSRHPKNRAQYASGASGSSISQPKKMATKAKYASQTAADVEASASQGPERMREMVMDIFGEQEPHPQSSRPSAHVVRGNTRHAAGPAPSPVPGRVRSTSPNSEGLATSQNSKDATSDLALPRLCVGITGSASAR